MSQFMAALSFLALVQRSIECIPTTTTPACCPMLAQSTLPRRAPSSTTFQQCSILRRVSSNCPTDGFVFCDAAPDTNPSTMQIEFFNVSGQVVRTIQRDGTTLTARIYCINQVWYVRSASTSANSLAINTVSCSQTGSTGSDQGYVIGEASD